jgi:RimJ/RimL family protein N-acetyltransferase
MTGIVIDKDDRSKRTAVLWGSWLRPDLRGKGLSDLLYGARIEWARRHPTCARIVVSHRVSNLSSKRAIQRHGFRWTHAEEKCWNDGAVENDHYYELVLDKLVE